MAIQGRRKGFYISNGVEQETFTCGHNQEVVKVPHGAKLEDLGVFCQMCQRPVCMACAAKMAATLKCDPFEEKLARAEGRVRLRESMAA